MICIEKSKTIKITLKKKRLVFIKIKLKSFCAFEFLHLFYHTLDQYNWNKKVDITI